MLLGLFWLLTLLAGARTPGYDLARDTFSALYARGSTQRAFAIPGGALLAVAHLPVAVRLLRCGRRGPATAFAGAGAAGLALLAVPISCPNGAAGCSGPLSGRGALSAAAALHRDVAVAYEVLFVLAVLVLAASLLRRGRHWAQAAALLAGAVLSSLVALQLRRGTLLGLWERGWLGTNTLVLLVVAVLLAGPLHVPRQRAARDLSVVGLGAGAVLLPLAVAAQPAFDLRRDLLSGLAAHGATLPELGQGVLVAIALAHLGLAVPLAARGRRVPAAAAVVACLALLGVAAARITCPHGAAGCSGPNSGRAEPRPFADTLHRDLVAAFELATIAMLVALALHLLRAEHRRVLGGAALAVAVVSPSLLLAQQRGVDIGWWQLGWIASTAAGVLVVLAAVRRPSPAGAAPSGPGPAATRAVGTPRRRSAGSAAGR